MSKLAETRKTIQERNHQILFNMNKFYMTLNKLIQSAEGRDLFIILYCTEALRMSVISNLASLTSSIKRNHVYRSGARVGDTFECQLEPENTQSTGRNAIKVVQTDGSIVGHVHEPVARRLAPLIRWGSITQVLHAPAEVIGTSRPAPEGTWTQGGGIEIPCKYILEGNKAYKKM